MPSSIPAATHIIAMSTCSMKIPEQPFHLADDQVSAPRPGFAMSQRIVYSRSAQIEAISTCDVSGVKAKSIGERSGDLL
ncbi:hypothetical protein TNCV_3655971 [Trichonephila clavipes]|nr:hypothetical protein TNCV_3655971 [Trichonephila clavipes]